MKTFEFWHAFIFLFGAVIGLIGSCLTLILGIPSPKWVLIFFIFATFAFVISFFCGVAIPDQNIFIIWLYFTHALGVFSLLLASIAVISEIVDTTHLFNTVGSSILVFGVVFLIIYVKKKPSAPIITITILLLFGTLSLLTSSIVTIWNFYVISQVFTLIAFICFTEIGIQKIIML